MAVMPMLGQFQTYTSQCHDTTIECLYVLYFKHVRPPRQQPSHRQGRPLKLPDDVVPHRVFRTPMGSPWFSTSNQVADFHNQAHIVFDYEKGNSEKPPECPSARKGDPVSLQGSFRLPARPEEESRVPWPEPDPSSIFFCVPYGNPPHHAGYGRIAGLRKSIISSTLRRCSSSSRTAEEER